MSQVTATLFSITGFQGDVIGLVNWAPSNKFIDAVKELHGLSEQWTVYQRGCAHRTKKNP